MMVSTMYTYNSYYVVFYDVDLHERFLSVFFVMNFENFWYFSFLSLT